MKFKIAIFGQFIFIFIFICLLLTFNIGIMQCNPDAKRLYDDLLSSYNKLVRPVTNTTDILKVFIKLKLSQLIDVVSPQSLFSKSLIF